MAEKGLTRRINADEQKHRLFVLLLSGYAVKRYIGLLSISTHGKPVITSFEGANRDLCYVMVSALKPDT